MNPSEKYLAENNGRFQPMFVTWDRGQDHNPQTDPVLYFVWIYFYDDLQFER